MRAFVLALLLVVGLVVPAAAQAPDLRRSMSQGWTFLEQAGNLRQAEASFQAAFDQPAGKDTAEVYYGMAAVWWERRNAMATWQWLSNAVAAAKASRTWDGGPEGEFDRRIHSRLRFLEKNFTVVKLRSPPSGKPVPPIADPPPSDPVLRSFTDRIEQSVQEGVDAEMAVLWLLLPNGTYWVGDRLVTLEGGETDPAKAVAWDLERDGLKAKRTAEERRRAITEGRSIAKERLDAARSAKRKEDEAAAADAEKAAEARRIDEERRVEDARRQQEERDRDAAERAEQARREREEAEAKRKAAAQAEQDRISAERAEAERLAAERAEAERLAAERAGAERRAAVDRAEAARRTEAERLERERLAKEQEEANRRAEEERAAAARLDAERREAERVEADRREAERRAQADQRAREQAEAERRSAERAQAERLDQERLDAERRAADLDRTERERREREAVEAAQEQERRRAEDQRRADDERRAAQRAEDERRAGAVREDAPPRQGQTREEPPAELGRGARTTPTLAEKPAPDPKSGGGIDSFRWFLRGGPGLAVVPGKVDGEAEASASWVAGLEVGANPWIVPSRLSLAVSVSYQSVPVSACDHQQSRAHLASVHLAPRLAVPISGAATLLAEVGAHVGAGFDGRDQGTRDRCADAAVAAAGQAPRYGIDVGTGAQAARLGYATLGWQGQSFVVGPSLDVAVVARPSGAAAALGGGLFLRHDQIFAILPSEKRYYALVGDGVGLATLDLGPISGAASMARFQFGLRGWVLF